MPTKHVKFYGGRPLCLGLFDAKEYGFDPLNMLSVVPDLSVVDLAGSSAANSFYAKCM